MKSLTLQSKPSFKKDLGKLKMLYMLPQIALPTDVPVYHNCFNLVRNGQGEISPLESVYQPQGTITIVINNPGSGLVSPKNP